MYRIAHITDLHIKYDNPEPNLLKFRELLHDALSSGCDHIVLTGDISDYADERDYDLIRALLIEFNLLSSNKLSVIPGNHDIYGGPSPDLPFYMYPTHCRKLDYDNKLVQFYNSFIETFDYTLTGDNSFLPYAKVLNDQCAVIGMNSIAKYSQYMNPLGTNGVVTKSQLEAVKQFLENDDIKDKIKLVLIHHHFNKPGESKAYPEHILWLKSEQHKMRLHKKSELFELFKKKKVNAVLHGHTHITDTYARKGCFFINSSGCSFPFTESGERQYHIIEIGNTAVGEKPFNLIRKTIA